MTDRTTTGPDDATRRSATGALPGQASADRPASGSALPAIEVGGLRKAYGEFVAVDGVDLTVERGEVFALLGPNGAGKTTTVEILEGHRHRDAGTVSVLGTDPGQAGRAWRSRIGIVLQTANDFSETTAEEAVRHFAHYYPSPRDPDEVLDLVGLSEKRRTRTRQLSGGQRRRLDVALGIIGDPELVFLDEPTTGFDPEARRHFWDLIRSLRERGSTILLTTHYLDEAEALADRVAVIAGGRILEIGTPATLGGRASASVTVRWDGPSGAESIATDTPTEVVLELSRRFGGEVPGLVVARPSLEDVYLAMINRVGAGQPGANQKGDLR